WKHLRDAFVKTEKNAKESKTSGSQATKKRKYIFNDKLQFLKKIYKKAETTESFIVEENNDETNGTSRQPENTVHEVGLTTARKEKALPSQLRRKHKKMDEVDLQIVKALDKTEPEILNPQMSFYHSLLPHTENFNSDEWLQFQMEVVRVISNIKNQKVPAPHYQGYIHNPLRSNIANQRYTIPNRSPFHSHFNNLFLAFNITHNLHISDLTTHHQFPQFPNKMHYLFHHPNQIKLQLWIRTPHNLHFFFHITTHPRLS
ncbi:hypothetical protein B7P43_G12939, partial [Cryptotermes secundus]